MLMDAAILGAAPVFWRPAFTIKIKGAGWLSA
jgi:hypothetical protein